MVETVARIEQALGPIELAILNAGTHEPVDARRFDAAVFDRLIAVNLTGTVNGLNAILPRLVARRAGHVALVASVAAMPACRPPRPTAPPRRR